MSWLSSTSILTNSEGTDYANAIFINTATGDCYLCGVKQPSIPAPGVWNLLDLKPLGVPANANSVDLGGILIITDGTNTSIADLAVSFRKPSGSITPESYVGQAVGISPQGGARTNGRWVTSCTNGCIEWAWLRGDSGEWPDHPAAPYPKGAAYGLNFTVQAIHLP